MCSSRKNFNVLAIAKDVNACWFDNALVRTCLIVAQKKKILPLSDTTDEETMIIDLGAELVGDHSLINNLSWNNLTGESALISLLAYKSNTNGNGFSVERRKTMTLFPQMLNSQCIPKWVLSEDIQSCPRDGGG